MLVLPSTVNDDDVVLFSRVLMDGLKSSAKYKVLGAKIKINSEIRDPSRTNFDFEKNGLLILNQNLYFKFRTRSFIFNQFQVINFFLCLLFQSRCFDLLFDIDLIRALSHSHHHG